MCLTKRFLPALLLMLMTVSATAATAPTPAFTQNGFDPGILDASVSRSERLKLFDQMMALANNGQVRAQDLAGTLFWRGSDIEGSPVDRNLDQARNLLANASVNGDVVAMAKLGELELADGRTMRAMVWAQMYARYLDPMASPRERRSRRAAYAADLIQRISDAGGAMDDTLRANVGTMVSRFDESIRHGIGAFSAERRSGESALFRRPSGTDKVEDRNRNGLAEYLVAFDTSGKPGKIWLLDSLPDAYADTMVRHYLDQVLAIPADDGRGTRYLKVSIVHNARKGRSLRPAH